MDRDSEEVERAKKYIRSFRSDKTIETFRFFHLTLGDMDRAELLGVICFLIKNQGFFPQDVKKVSND